jgi:DNA repair protein RadC
MDQLEHVSNAELLSKLAGKSVADALVQQFGGLTDLAQASFDELQLIKGIGKSKAAAIKSAFLLAQRLSRESYREAPLLDTPERVADLLREQNRAYTVEHFQVVFLNTRRRLIGMQNLSQGTLDTLLVDARTVFAPAIAKRASGIVLVHNHPSGDPTPSEADIKVTRDLIRAGQLLKIEVLDHVILGRRTDERPRDYVSLREAGYFFT